MGKNLIWEWILLSESFIAFCAKQCVIRFNSQLNYIWLLSCVHSKGQRLKSQNIVTRITKMEIIILDYCSSMGFDNIQLQSPFPPFLYFKDEIEIVFMDILNKHYNYVCDLMRLINLAYQTLMLDRNNLV